ncbi:MAG: hypothetical protein ABJC26_16610 [Gemmatimonadaceae bacterium]
MRSQRRLRCAVALALASVTLAGACHKPPNIIPGGAHKVAYLDDFYPDARPAGDGDSIERERTMLYEPYALARDSAPSMRLPCKIPGAEAVRGVAVAHARSLWALRGSAPYTKPEKDPTVAYCMWYAYEQAVHLSPQDQLIKVEYATVRLLATNMETRLEALRLMDEIVDSLLAAGETKTAVTAMSSTAKILWVTTQRMLERPAGLNWFSEEKYFHNLANDALPLRSLPPLPKPSDRLGVSEAAWIASLYARSARLTLSNPALQASFVRNAIMPYVAMRDWKGVDSVAVSFHDLRAADSVTRIATALATYKRSTSSPTDQAISMRAFDQALLHMPRADSARYDSFDGLLGTADDEWRYEHLPSELRQLDLRGWSLLDPLWSTPVNEVRLAHRSRIVESNFLYGSDASFGQSGSETPAGIMLMERGSPDERWKIVTRYTSIPETMEQRATGASLVRGWPGYALAVRLGQLTPLFVSQLYESRLSMQFIARFVHDQRSFENYPCSRGVAVRTFALCAQWEAANWDDVPYQVGMDTIDVAVARFRAANSRADIYIGARIPLRRFPLAGKGKSSSADSITTAFWIATPLGDSLLHAEQKRARPVKDEIDYRMQYRAQLASVVIMHRVEAFDAKAIRSARGGALLTRDATTQLTSAGFGVSDILVAATATAAKRTPSSWRDFELVPNGASVSPRSTFALLWEIYDLKPDNNGRVRWRVTVRTEKGRRIFADVRSTIEASSGAATQVVKNESDAPQMSFVRDAVAAPVIVDQMNYGLADLPPGRHVVQVQVDDLVSGNSVTRTVSVRVLDPKVQRRLSGD